jgi:quercetin dioxygenase-like cupin family protein
VYTPINPNSFARRLNRRRPRFLVAVAVAALGLVAVGGAIATASAPSGVVPTVLARGTFDAFKVMSYPDNGGLFKAEAKAPIDLVVRRHEYAVGATTGWHAHPYPVFITVISGTLTFYEADDPTCTPIVVSAGHGYVDSGNGHIGRNESGEPAVDISVIMAPVGAPFRSELPAPNPYCGF